MFSKTYNGQTLHTAFRFIVGLLAVVICPGVQATTQSFPTPSTLTQCAQSVDISAQAYGALPKPQALPYMEHAYSICRQREGLDHQNTLASMHNLAVIYSELGRHAEALKLDIETLRHRQTVLGRDHPDTLSTMLNVGNEYSILGRHDEALKVREEMLAVTRSKLGKNDPLTFNSMNNVANSYFDLGRYPQAAKMNEETLALRETHLGRNHPATLASMNNLANTYTAMGRTADARKLREELFLPIAEKSPRIGGVADQPSVHVPFWTHIFIFALPLYVLALLVELVIAAFSKRNKSVRKNLQENRPIDEPNDKPKVLAFAPLFPKVERLVLTPLLLLFFFAYSFALIGEVMSFKNGGVMPVPGLQSSYILTMGGSAILGFGFLFKCWLKGRQWKGMVLGFLLAGFVVSIYLTGVQLELSAR
jgi:tetratricopeptide (TPR) repeat protein